MIRVNSFLFFAAWHHGTPGGCFLYFAAWHHSTPGGCFLSASCASYNTKKPVQKVPAVYKIAQQKNPVTAFFVFSFVSIICIRFKGSKPTGLLSGHPTSPLFLMFNYTIVSFSGQEFPAIFSHNSHNFAVFSFHTKLHTLSARVRNKSCAAQTLAKHFLIFSFLFRKTVV